MSPEFPFYRFTSEDNIAFQLMCNGKLDPDGTISKRIQKLFLNKPIMLDPASIKSINELINKVTVVKGRIKSIPMDLEITIKEIALKTKDVAKRHFGKNLDIILDGGSLWNVLDNLFLGILKEWNAADTKTKAVTSCVSPLFKSLIKATPNDHDWQFLTYVKDLSDNQMIINEGVVTLLAEKLKSKSISPELLIKELERLKQYAGSLQKDCYLPQVFEAHPIILAKLPDFYSLAIKALGFSSAVDIVSTGKDSKFSFSLRTIGDGSESHDCLFPIQIRKTITPINSLYVNITTLINGQKNPEIHLNSFLGTSKILQAIVDRNLFLFTFEDDAVADWLDFGRTISHYTQGGRCYKKGWLQKTVDPFLKESKARNTTLSEMLFNQLVSRTTNHHKGETTIFIALAFNASCLLFWRDRSYSSEIKKLWNLISSYLLQKGGRFEALKSSPLILKIVEFMKIPNTSFEDLYAQIQVSSFVIQNCILKDEIDYSCKPSQTEGDLYTQIQIPLPKKTGDVKRLFDNCTLFFPYDLPHAILHIKKVSEVSPTIFETLGHIHTTMLPSGKYSFGFEKSIFQEYNKDIRRNLKACQLKVLDLLAENNEHLWKLGYFLALSILALKKDNYFLKQFLKQLIVMLLEKWATDQFKRELLVTFNEALKNSCIPLNRPLFEQWNKLEIIRDLLYTKSNPFVELALGSLDKYEKEMNYDSLVSFYKNILNDCVSFAKAQEVKELSTPQRPLKDMIFNLPNKILSETGIDWLIKLYSCKSIISSTELEQSIFDSMLKILQGIKSLPKTFSQKAKSQLTQTSLCIIQNPNRAREPVKGILFAQEMIRLNIIEGDKSKESYEAAFLTILENLTGQEDINLQDLGKQVNVSLSTFGRRNHKSYLLIKKFIETKLHESLQKTLSLNDFETCFALLKGLVHSTPRWYERNLILDALTKLSCIETENKNIGTEELLNTYLSSVSSISQEEKVQFLLSRLDKESSLSPLLLKLIYNLLTIPLTEFSTQSYQKCTMHLLDATLLYPEYIHSNKLDLGKYLAQLNAHKLWLEIVELYAAEPAIHPGFSPEYVEILINSCQQLLIKVSPEIAFSKIEKVLGKIPKASIDQPNLEADLIEIIQYLYENYLRLKNYTLAMKWLEKEMLFNSSLHKDFYQRVFNVINLQLENRKFQITDKWIDMLQTTQGYEREWIDFFKSLLEQEKISLCVKLLKNKNDALGINHHIHHSEWVKILEKNLLKTQKLAKTTDDTNQNFLKDMCEMNHKLICQCKLDESKLWIIHIDNSTILASIQSVEEIFFLLTGKENKLPFRKNEKIVCWKWVLKSLSHRPSRVFFNISEWWPYIWKEFNSESSKEVKLLLYYVINGAAKAIEPPKRQNSTEKVLNRELTEDMIKGAKALTEILDTNEIKRILDNIDNAPTYHNISKIYWSTRELEQEANAITCLNNTLTKYNYDQTDKKDLFLLFSEYLEVLSCNEQSINAMINLIESICEIPQLDISTSFAMLEFFNRMFKIQDTISNNLSIPPNLISYIDSMEKAIWGILEYQGKKITHVREEKKLIIRNTLEWVCKTDTFEGLELIKRCLEKNSLQNFVDNSYIQKLKEYTESVQLSWARQKTYQVLKKMSFNYLRFTLPKNEIPTKSVMNIQNKRIRWIKNIDKFNNSLLIPFCKIMFVSYAILAIFNKTFDAYFPPHSSCKI